MKKFLMPNPLSAACYIMGCQPHRAALAGAGTGVRLNVSRKMQPDRLMKMTTARIAAMVVLSALLSGCVAALIPVAAGGVLAANDKNRIVPKSRQSDTGSIPDAASTAAAEPVFAQTAAPAKQTPSAGASLATGLQHPMSGYQVFSGILNYADTQAGLDPISEPRQSAILAAPGSLTPQRSDCSIRPPAVMFDLDPAGAVFDPVAETKAAPALAQILSAFRLQEIAIFWISELPALDAGAVRKRLVESGLDPIGRDGLILMRRADDRKQTRRRELSETHCVIAIAGDTKSDFDELYDYLKDPSAAQPLDAMLEAGWFLTPLPLLNPSITEAQ